MRLEIQTHALVPFLLLEITVNAIIYAMNKVFNSIPRELLTAAAYIDEPEDVARLTTVEDKILNKVIKKIVLLDCNIVGGIETIIPLTGITPAHYEQHYTIYHIPPEATNEKEIVSVLNLSFLPGNALTQQGPGYYSNSGAPSLGTISGYTSFNPVMNVANRIGDSHAISGVMTNAHTELVGHNTVLVYASYRSLGNFGLRVVLENDSNLNNIQPRSYDNFAQLCELAVKSYIYNKLIIPVNNGYLMSGQELGIFKSILESYSSAYEDYRIYKNEVWTPVAYMNDVTRFNRLVGSMLSPDL